MFSALAPLAISLKVEWDIYIHKQEKSQFDQTGREKYSSIIQSQKLN